MRFLMSIQRNKKNLWTILKKSGISRRRQSSYFSRRDDHPLFAVDYSHVVVKGATPHWCRRTVCWKNICVIIWYFKSIPFPALYRAFYCQVQKLGENPLGLDNARAHHSKGLELSLEDNKDKGDFSFLPSYSPHLNPMEWIWKFLNKQVMPNIFFNIFKKFVRAFIKFIRKFKLLDWKLTIATVLRNYLC